MNKRDRALLMATIANNKLNVALHTVTGMALIGSSVAFSTMVALYFGFDVLGIKNLPQLDVLAENKTYAISAAIVFAVISLVSRAGQIIVEGKVTVEQERWLAEKLRQQPEAKLVPGNIARASNYYGRLSTTSMRTASIVCILIISLIVLVAHLPPHFGLVGIGVLASCVAGLYIVMRILSGKVTDATLGLFQHAKDTGRWKVDSESLHNNAIDLYYRSYFNRIILSSAFSFAPLLFALAFAVFMLIMHETEAINVDLGQIFIVFALLRAYLSLVSNFFSSLLHSVAFIPAIKPYAHFIPGFSLPPENQASVGTKYIPVEDPLFEGDSIEEI